MKPLYYPPLAAALLFFTPSCDSGDDSSTSFSAPQTQAAVQQACLEGNTIEFTGELSARAVTTEGQSITITLKADIDLDVDFRENGTTLTSGSLTITEASSSQNNTAAQDLVGETLTLAATEGTFDCNSDPAQGTSGSFTEGNFTFDYSVRLTSDTVGTFTMDFSGEEEGLAFNGDLDGTFVIVE